MLPLRAYQSEGLAAVHAATARDVKTPLLSWPCGLGKTVLFAHWLAQREGRALVLAHREELLTQAQDKFKLIAPQLQTGIVKAERDETDADVVIGSVQTLHQDSRLLRCLEGGLFTSAVVDEAHHSEAASYRKIIRLLQASGVRAILGVTATPARADKRPLGRTWAELVHHLTILDGIHMGYLSNVRAERIRVDADFRGLHSRHGDVVESEAGRLLLDANAPESIAKAIVESAAGRQTVVFTAGVEMAHQTARACRDAGLTASWISGETGGEERRDILDDFHRGEIQVLTNCYVLTEGWDEPNVSCVVMARPTQSQPFYAQCVGRGLRPYPGKVDCLVLDVVGVTTRHDLITLPELFGPDISDVMKNMLAHGTGIREAEESENALGNLHRTKVDVFAVREFAWVRARGGWVLSLGGRDAGWVALTECPEGWAVMHVRPQGEECKWVGASLEYAQGVGEDYVRAAGALVLASRGAPWRRRPATVGQKEALARFGEGWSDRMTCGDAADKLTALIAGRRRR